mmetsp:Transcript_3614/g.6261  ORF Transcript_3614/g.6261 Transcript_3614/m.6261 type:complete len:366 (+) Transcript_3614:7879-8976(+)
MNSADPWTGCCSTCWSLMIPHRSSSPTTTRSVLSEGGCCVGPCARDAAWPTNGCQPPGGGGHRWRIRWRCGRRGARGCGGGWQSLRSSSSSRGSSASFPLRTDHTNSRPRPRASRAFSASGTTSQQPSGSGCRSARPARVACGVGWGMAGEGHCPRGGATAQWELGMQPDLGGGATTVGTTVQRPRAGATWGEDLCVGVPTRQRLVLGVGRGLGWGTPRQSVGFGSGPDGRTAGRRAGIGSARDAARKVYTGHGRRTVIQAASSSAPEASSGRSCPFSFDFSDLGAAVPCPSAALPFFLLSEMGCTSSEPSPRWVLSGSSCPAPAFRPSARPFSAPCAAAAVACAPSAICSFPALPGPTCRSPSL